MAAAPIGIPIDLIRVIPDENMTFGRAFGGNVEQFTQGLAGLSQGTGLSAVAEGVARNTPIDEALGAIMFQMELTYNQELQLATGQTPLDIGKVIGPLDPGDISVARVVGTGLAQQALLSPIGVINNLRTGEGFSGLLDNYLQAYNRTDPRIMGLSPGQGYILNTTGAINLSELELREYMGSTGFKVASGMVDTVTRWYTQPEVIAGKTVRVARAKWIPSVMRKLDDLNKSGIPVKSIEEAIEGGALNLQIDLPEGQSVYHVTTSSQLNNIVESGIMKVPPGAEQGFYSGSRMRNFAERMRQELSDLIDDIDSDGGRMNMDRMSTDDIMVLEEAYGDVIERINSRIPELTDEFMDQIPLTSADIIEESRLFQLLSPDNLDDFIDGSDLEDILNMASNPLERRSLAVAIYAKNSEITPTTSLGLTDTIRIPAAHNRSIYLLGENEIDEAYRYAAALYQQNPGDMPVIIKLNPKGLPVIFDDFTNPMRPDPRSGMPSDASLVTSVDNISPENIIEIIRPTIGELDISISTAKVVPDYLKPGGRMNERLFNPDGSPIRPEDILPFEKIEEQYLGMVEAYNSGGPEASIKFAQAAMQKRKGVGPANLSEALTSEKRVQMAINQMDGMDADEILRRWLDNVPGGPVIATMLADEGSYDLRRQIWLAAAGVFDPDTTMLAPITRARIRALRNTVADMEVSPEYMRYKRDLKLGMIDELDQGTSARYLALEKAVLDEVDELYDVEALGNFLTNVSEYVGLIDTMPRYSRFMNLKQNIRSSHWYQESTLSRPIRALGEKRPTRWLSTEDPTGDIQIVRQLQEARPLGIKADTVKSYRIRYMAATNEAEKVRIVMQMDEEIITAGLLKSGLERSELEQFISASRRGKATAQEVLKSRRYAPDDLDMVTFVDPFTGEVVKMSMPTFGTQLQNWIPMTDVRELIRVSSQVRRNISRYGGRDIGRTMDSFINLWKPSVLLRGGWPIRVVSDEQLRILALTGSLVRHLAAIEAGEIPPWGFANIFGPGRTGPQRIASTFGLPISIITSGSVRAAGKISRGAQKLKVLNPQFYDDLNAVGTEPLASSRASYAGPNETILQEGAALFGVYEVGIMDHLITNGTGEWTSVAKNHRQYFPAWKRALQDQLGRDPLARIFLEYGGSEVPSIITWNPNRRAILLGIEDVFDTQNKAGFLDNLDAITSNQMDDIADEIFDIYEAMSRDNLGVRIDLDTMELENEIIRILENNLDLTDLNTGLPMADQWVLAEEITRRVEGWREAVIDEVAEFAHLRQNGTLNPRYTEPRLREWFDDTIGTEWESIPEFVDIYNSIGRRWLVSTLNDIDDVADEVKRAFINASIDTEFANRWSLDSESIRSMLDDFRGMYKESWRQARTIEIPSTENARMRASNWLNNTPEGAEYKTRLPWRSNTEKWLDDAEEIVRIYSADFNPSLTTAALNGKVNREILGSVDEAIRPPTIHAEVIEQTLGTSVVMQWTKEFTSTAMDTFGRLPTDTLSRQPFFKHIYAREMERARKLVAKQGVELTEEIIQKMNVQSRAYALREVKKWLYDLSETSRFGQMMRWYIPFYPAWQEVLEVWGGIAMRDPSVIGRGMLIWRAPNKLGIVETDDEGNEFIVLRLSEKVVDGMGLEGWQRYIAEGGVSFGKGSFNMITNNPFPSVGPVIQVPINEVVKNRPDLEEALRFILPYGVKPNSLSIIASPIIKRAGALISGPSGDASYQRDFTNAVIWLDWRFRSGESSIPPSYEEAHNIAKKIWTIRLFANITAPAQPIFNTPLKPYIDIYRDLMETLGPEAADEAFLGQYGKEFFAITMSRTVSRTGIPPTVEGQAARQRFDRLITKYPEYGRFIIGEDSAIGEFSSAAFAWQLSNPPTDDPSFFGEPDREYRNLELDPETGAITEVDRRLGWQEYIKAMDLIDLERRKRGLPNLQVKQAEDLANMKRSLTNAIGEKYPEWWRDFNNRSDLKWPDRIKALREISTAVLRVEDRPDMEGIQSYLEARATVLQELNHRKQLGGSSTLGAKSNSDLQQIWSAMVNKILEDNIHFLPVYYRYLEGDPVELNNG